MSEAPKVIDLDRDAIKRGLARRLDRARRCARAARIRSRAISPAPSRIRSRPSIRRAA